MTLLKPRLTKIRLFRIYLAYNTRQETAPPTLEGETRNFTISTPRFPLSRTRLAMAKKNNQKAQMQWFPTRMQPALRSTTNMLAAVPAPTTADPEKEKTWGNTRQEIIRGFPT